ncbi:fibronectin type 3 and ankyrin repeat domains protein 1 isoform X2 [Ornithorhynchus anatinus]|uniref:fibronectin type 3 and ankyrin repeat domains protein 1 isoform X2 n=1 Tax=Ornithorhynchus anatinus TaxID=9258 RepID=UPI0010A7F33D|nr:fibronectin type 3 and ankyrin repeat domains protein 1 isoform X2 [Ornithorhynchus anatinus]
METCSSPALPKPRPPVVGEVNHHSIKLCWEAERPAQRSGPQERWLRFSVEEEDAKRHTFGIIYTGYATQHVVEGLEPRTLYRFRLKVTSPTGESEYSPVVAVSTTREPLSSEHLHRAVTMNDEELLVRVLQGRLVKILVQNGTDVSGRNSSGKDSLMLACYSGHLDIVQYLRAHGASWEARDLGGCTALHWAADGGHCHVIEWMLQDGCKVNVLDAVSGWSPLMRVSAVSGHRDVASLLIEAGADVNVRDKDGKTPLMVAVLNNHEELVQLLLDKGADPNVTNEVTPAGRDTRGVRQERPADGQSFRQREPGGLAGGTEAGPRDQEAACFLSPGRVRGGPASLWPHPPGSSSASDVPPAPRPAPRPHLCPVPPPPCPVPPHVLPCAACKPCCLPSALDASLLPLTEFAGPGPGPPTPPPLASCPLVLSLLAPECQPRNRQL